MLCLCSFCTLFKGILNGISLGTHARGLWRFPKGSHCRRVAQAPNPGPGRRLQSLTRVDEFDPTFVDTWRWYYSVAINVPHDPVLDQCRGEKGARVNQFAILSSSIISSSAILSQGVKRHGNRSTCERLQAWVHFPRYTK